MALCIDDARATLGCCVGCGTPPGQPRAGSIPLAPNDVVEFDALYANNCAGCHGANGRGGAAIALANPVYLAIVDERSMRAIIADGVRDTSMPAFAQRAGGMLTEKQIDAIVSGIRSRWSGPAALDGANPPSYAATSAGDIHREKPCTRRSVNRATARTVEAVRREAPSRTIRFWRWRAISICERS